MSFILPSEFNIDCLKNFDKSDPKMFDIKNYDINTFEIGNGHNCLGTELDGYLKDIKPVKCKLLNIASRLGHPSFHFEIDGKFYFYGLKGVNS